MYEIENYLGDPFSDNAITARAKTQYFMVPSSSPYRVQLDGQPKQDDPSSVSVVDMGIDGTSNITLTEVSTDPQTNQFQVDYDYNTGLIRFNENQALHLVRITYSSIGSPTDAAKIRRMLKYPPRAFDVRNGAGGGFVSNGSNALSGEREYSYFVIKSGDTVTMNGEWLNLHVDGPVIIRGTLNGDGVVESESASPFPGIMSGSFESNLQYDNFAINQYLLRSWESNIFHGKCGRDSDGDAMRSTKGGGGLLIVARQIYISGMITMKGVGTSLANHTAGSGGIAILVAPYIEVSGPVSLVGGSASHGYVGPTGYYRAIQLD